MHKSGYVYILSSPNRGTLYTGVTSKLVARIWEHKNKAYRQSFTSRYNCVVLVYYDAFETIESAIAEEKRLKGSSRKYKEELIDAMNPTWRDLYDDIL